MPYERFYELERKFREIGEKIVQTIDAMELHELNAGQPEILSQYLQIIKRSSQPKNVNRIVLVSRRN